MKWVVLLMALMFTGCQPANRGPLFFGKKEPVTICLQPFRDLPPSLSKHVFQELKKRYPHVQLLEPIELPQAAWYGPRKRYRADTLIHWLKKRAEEGVVVVGMTCRDISTTKGSLRDYGVMGLGFQPGPSCVASTFRLNQQKLREQFFKVVVHELGHTQGIGHCPEKTCFMRDAGGGNPTDEEQAFCSQCTKVLKSRGWMLDQDATPN